MSKPFLKHLIPIFEDVVKLFLYEQVVGNRPEKTEGQLECDDVGCLNAGFYLAKVMLMVPESIRPYPLFVDKKCRLLDMTDLCHPGYRKTE